MTQHNSGEVYRVRSSLQPQPAQHTPPAAQLQTSTQDHVVAQSVTYTKTDAELHEALGLKGAGNAAVEGFFVTAPGHQDLCVEVRAAEHGNSTSEEEETRVKKTLKYHGRLGRGN